MSNWLSKIIKNQISKIEGFFYAKKINRFKKSFKHCGKNISIRFPVCIEGAANVSIGDNVSINAFVHMWGNCNINIGNDCLIASHVSITSLSHDTESDLYKNVIIGKEINIGNNVWIGTHAIILPGVTIGDNSIVGAGAMVNNNVPANVVVGGIPATIIKHLKR